jgi:anti-sigma factor RsiW
VSETPREDPTLLLHAALDGELDAVGMLEIEATLAADPALAAEYARLGALRDAIRARIPRERASESLRARIMSMTQAPSEAPGPAPESLGAPGHIVDADRQPGAGARASTPKAA